MSEYSDNIIEPKGRIMQIRFRYLCEQVTRGELFSIIEC